MTLKLKNKKIDLFADDRSPYSHVQPTNTRGKPHFYALLLIAKQGDSNKFRLKLKVNIIEDAANLFCQQHVYEFNNDASRPSRLLENHSTAPRRTDI